MCKKCLATSVAQRVLGGQSKGLAAAIQRGEIDMRLLLGKPPSQSHHPAGPRDEQRGQEDDALILRDIDPYDNYGMNA
jgi:hypothetical protein